MLVSNFGKKAGESLLKNLKRIICQIRPVLAVRALPTDLQTLQPAFSCDRLSVRECFEKWGLGPIGFFAGLDGLLGHARHSPEESFD